MNKKTEKINFNVIHKQYEPILISNRDKLDQAFVEGLNVIALKKKKNKPIKTVGTRSGDKTPKWFLKWSKNFNVWSKHVNDFIDNQQKFNQDQQKFNAQVSNFMINQQKFNQDQQKFNELIMKRLDNLVSKNNLKE